MVNHGQVSMMERARLKRLAQCGSSLCLTVSLVLCFYPIQVTKSQEILGPTNFSMVPQQVTLTPNESFPVTFHCSPPDSVTQGRMLVLAINIARTTAPRTPDDMFVSADLQVQNGTARVLPTSPLQGPVNVSGSTQQCFITLTINSVSCIDARTYACNADGLINSQPSKYSSEKDLTISVNPEPITMDTPGTGCCMLGQTLRMTCGQFVGLDDNSSQHNWVWEFKNKTAADWQTYAVIGNPTADITQRQPPSTDPCYKHHSSSLTRRLTLEDSGRQYRCYVNGSVTGQGVDKAKVHTVSTVQAPGDGNQGKDETDNTSNASNSQASATNWLAISLGVAGAVVCLGVGLGVAHHCRRKGSGQQTNPETVTNTGDTAHVGQSGQDPYDAIDDNASEATTASDADTASDASSDVD